jgi:hypothetical protein
MQFVVIIYCDTRVIRCHAHGEYYLCSSTFVRVTNEHRGREGSKVLFHMFVFVLISMPPFRFLHHSGMNVSKVRRSPAGQDHRSSYSGLTHTHTHTHIIHSSPCAWLYIHLSERGRAKSTVYVPSYRNPGVQFRSHYVQINTKLTN